MKKICFLILGFLFGLMPINVKAGDTIELNSTNAIVYDLDTKEIIFEKNAKEIHSIASLTKIVTVITAIEKIDDLDQQVVITKEMLSNIYWNASVAGLKVGDIVTFRDLLYAAILPSGADATQVLAYSLSGNVDAFVNEMNVLVSKLGLENTHFVNTTGLDAENHYSSAYDICLLLAYALENEVFKEVYTTKKYTLTNGLEVVSTLESFNEFMNVDTTEILGSKTGNTNQAGLCMSALFSHKNHDIILVTLGASKENDVYLHIIDSINLINYIQSTYEINDSVLPTFLEENEIVEEIKTFDYKKYWGVFLVALLILVLFNKKKFRF